MGQGKRRLRHRQLLRPSTWVEPLGDWGRGFVELVEIPTDREIHDNIVAYNTWQARIYTFAIGGGADIPLLEAVAEALVLVGPETASATNL